MTADRGERRRIQLVSPMGPRSNGPVTAAVRPSTLRGVRIGLLANGKANGDLLLLAVGGILRVRHGAVVGPLVVKPHASLPASADVLDTFATQVAVVLSAIGD